MSSIGFGGRRLSSHESDDQDMTFGEQDPFDPHSESDNHESLGVCNYLADLLRNKMNCLQGQLNIVKT